MPLSKSKSINHGHGGSFSADADEQGVGVDISPRHVEEEGQDVLSMDDADAYADDEPTDAHHFMMMMTPTPSNDNETGNGKRRHHITVKALKVLLATATVGTIWVWGVTKVSKESTGVTAALKMTGPKASKAPTVSAKSKKGKGNSKAGKEDSKSPEPEDGPVFRVEATGTVETTFAEWPSPGQTETESLRVAVNGVQQTLQKNLCDENEDIQDPECLVTAIVGTRRRQLDERGRSLQEKVILTDWTISFSVPCITPTCDDEAAQAQAAAEAIATLIEQYNSLTANEYRDGYLAALTLLPSPPAAVTVTYWNTVTFDVQQGVISGGPVVDPTTLPFNLAQIEAAGYTLVGQGYSLDAVRLYYCGLGWTKDNGPVSTAEQCATECQGQSTCYGGIGTIFRGFDFRTDNPTPEIPICFCNFDCDHTFTTLPATCDSFNYKDYWKTSGSIDGNGPVAATDQSSNWYAFKLTV